MRAAVLTGPFPDLEPYTESAELSRFVLLDRVPANGETWLLGRLWAHLRRESAIRGVVAFSDPMPRRRHGRLITPGHWGTIYQAGGSAYLGRGRARTLTVLPDGTVLNDRCGGETPGGERGWRYVRDRLVALGATPPPGPGAPARDWLPAALHAVGAQQRRHGGNLRYGFPLARGVRLGQPTMPYPKRDLVAAHHPE